MIHSNFNYFHKQATEKQKKYIKDLMQKKNVNIEVDFENMKMNQAGNLINQLKKAEINHA